MPLDVIDLVNEVAALLGRELAAQRVIPQLELAPSVPPIIGDRVQLQQVIINLVMNGAEAMQAITDRLPRLVVRTYQDETLRVAVVVEDSGPGVAARTPTAFSTRSSAPSPAMGMGFRSAARSSRPMAADCGRWRMPARRHLPVRLAAASGECGVSRTIEIERK